MAKRPTADVGKARSDDMGKAQWRRIAATVKPIREPSPSPLAGEAREGWQLAAYRTLERGLAQPDNADALLLPARKLAKQPTAKRGLSSPARGDERASANTLDASWDSRIKSGRLEPDFTIDLHGHNLASAHTHLARALDRAVRDGARVILLIAGKARGPDEAPRGAIRRELETWLSHSRHAGRIAAVRNAHPRHGGAGALYLVLRRPGV